MSDSSTSKPVPMWALDAHLDGVSTPAGRPAEHETTRQTLDALRQENARLTAALFRLHCPEPDRLLNVQWGLAGTTETQVITSHLLRCPYCAADAAQLGPETIAQPTAGALAQLLADWRTRFQRWVARPLSPHLVPAPLRQALRDAEEKEGEGVWHTPEGGVFVDTRTHTFTVEGLEDAAIILTQWRNADGRCTVQGQLLGIASPVEAAVVGDEGLLATATLGEASIFHWADLPPAQPYTFCFSSPTLEIYVPFAFNEGIGGWDADTRR